jgi:hypothetical protein
MIWFWKLFQGSRVLYLYPGVSCMESNNNDGWTMDTAETATGNKRMKKSRVPQKK